MINTFKTKNKNIKMKKFRCLMKIKKKRNLRGCLLLKKDRSKGKRRENLLNRVLGSSRNLSPKPY